MPGLCGRLIWNDKRIDEHVLRRARTIHALAGLEFPEVISSSDHCLIANFLPAPDCVATQSHARVADTELFLEGEVFNIPEIKNLFKADSPDAASILLYGYLRLGPEFVENVNGEFSIVVYEHINRRLFVFSDHVSSQPMYYAQESDGIVFGAEKKLLMALSDRAFELDIVGLLQPFVHVHNIGERTFLKGIHRLTPGQYLMASDGGLELAETHLLRFDGESSERASNLVNRWESEIKRATASRVTSDRSVLMSLSAGLDSRAISCAIDRRQRPIFARTWGTADSGEVRYASQIAQRLGFDQFVENPMDFRHSDALHGIVWRTEGEIPYKNGISIFSHNKMKPLCSHIAGGWLGDASSGAHLRPFMFRPANRSTFLEKVFNWYAVCTPPFMNRVFQANVVAQFLPEVRELFYRSYDRLNEYDNVTAHEFWDLYNRQTRMTISSMPVDSHAFQKVRPFFDRYYLEFVFSLPKRLKFGQCLYKSLIYRMGSEIHDIPDANTDALLHASPIGNALHYMWSNRQKVVQKVASRAGINVRRFGLTPAEDLANSMRSDYAMREIIASFVESDYCDGSIFNKQGIRTLLDEHYSGQADHSYILSRLATLSVALPYFLYERPSTCPEEAKPLLVSSR